MKYGDNTTFLYFHWLACCVCVCFMERLLGPYHWMGSLTAYGCDVFVVLLEMYHCTASSTVLCM